VLFDNEGVELSNLNRQVLFDEKDIGRFKVEVVAEQIKKLFDRNKISIEIRSERIELHSIHQLSPIHSNPLDFIIDCTDSVSTKYLLNDFAVCYGVPFCYAGAVAERGLLMRVVPAIGDACLRCVFGEDVLEEEETSCRISGVVGASVGFIGFGLARVVIDSIFSKEAQQKLYIYDNSKLTVKESVVKKLTNCRCSKKRTILDLRHKKCPETYLYTKVAYETLPKFHLLEVLYQNEKYVNNVYESCLEDGIPVLFPPQPKGAACWNLILEK
jgi:molybdopterin/thiamine biosynthesis adenylyltransferase